MFQLLLILALVCEVVGNPCVRYHLMDMYNGRRLLQSTLDYPYICDSDHIISGAWQKFIWNGENFKLTENCISAENCGTFGTIWLDTRQNYLQENKIYEGHVCINYDWSLNSCFEAPYYGCTESYNINVTRCVHGHGGSFYLYQLPRTRYCDTAFCVQPAEENEYGGDLILCDKCLEIMIELPMHISYFYMDTVWETFYFVCQYDKINDFGEVSLENSTYYATSYETSTTVACFTPKEHGRYTVKLIYFSWKYTIDRSVQVIIFDSVTHSCNVKGKCSSKSGLQDETENNGTATESKTGDEYGAFEEDKRLYKTSSISSTQIIASPELSTDIWQTSEHLLNLVITDAILPSEEAIFQSTPSINNIYKNLTSSLSKSIGFENLTDDTDLDNTFSIGPETSIPMDREEGPETSIPMDREEGPETSIPMDREAVPHVLSTSEEIYTALSTDSIKQNSLLSSQQNHLLPSQTSESSSFSQHINNKLLGSRSVHFLHDSVMQSIDDTDLDKTLSIKPETSLPMDREAVPNVLSTSGEIFTALSTDSIKQNSLLPSQQNHFLPSQTSLSSSISQPDKGSRNIQVLHDSVMESIGINSQKMNSREQVGLRKSDEDENSTHSWTINNY